MSAADTRRASHTCDTRELRSTLTVTYTVQTQHLSVTRRSCDNKQLHHLVEHRTGDDIKALCSWENASTPRTKSNGFWVIFYRDSSKLELHQGSHLAIRAQDRGCRYLEIRASQRLVYCMICKTMWYNQLMQNITLSSLGYNPTFPRNKLYSRVDNGWKLSINFNFKKLKVIQFFLNLICL